MPQDDKYGLEPADEDKYGLQPAGGGGTATATAEPLSDEEIEGAYGKDVSPKIRQALKTGVAKMQPPTNFEQENAHPYLESLGAREPGTSMQPQEYLGLPNTRLLKEAGKGALDLAKSTAGAAYDVGLGKVNPDTGNIEEHGLGGLVGQNTKGEIAPIERIGALTRKYVTDPAVAEWDKGTAEGGLPEIGHKAAAMLPLVGPWAAGLGERAGTGDVAGAGAEAAGQVGLGEIAHEAPSVKDVAKKVAFGTPITEEGKLAAATQQALTVKKPSMSETEYQQKVTDALPDLQKIAQDNKGQIKTPRQAVTGINNRIAEMEAPISDHLQAHPDEVVHPDEYVADLHSAMDSALKNSNVKLTPKEMDTAKAKVMELIGDQQQPLTEIEKTRRRLNTEAEDYFSSRPADKRVMDASDATAIAQKAAGNYLRSRLYGDDAKPGWLERAGVTAVDQAGNPVSMRDFRKKVGNLIDVRDHFEDAMVKAETTGDWKPFDKLFGGPSLAAGGAGVMTGLVAGGPLGGLLGLLGGEGLKAWGDYLRSKNPNLNVQKMFENLEQTRTPNTAQVQTRAPLHDYKFPIGPRTSDFAEPLGPARAPGNFQMEDLAPNRSSLWQQPVGELPPIETGAPRPGRLPEPIGPQPAKEAPLGPITGTQEPLNLPEPQHELFNLPQTPRVGGAPAVEPGEVGGAGREGTLQPIKTTPAEGLKIGDTFVDDKGDPRRITEIAEDGTIKTADHTLRDYPEGEVKHLGEINSPKAQLARGGMLHAPVEEAEGRYDLGEIGGEEGKAGEVKPMTPPGRVFRAQNVGETALNPETHAHATASPEEAQRYAEGRGSVEGKPQEIRSIDLAKLKPEDYTTFKGPNGNDWVKFNRQLEPHEFEPADVRISTRTPTAMKATENAHTTPLQIDMKSVTDAKDLPPKLAAVIKSYPEMKGVLKGAKTPTEVLNRFVEHVSNNLEWLHNQMPPEVREITRKWYDSANGMAKDMADKYGYDQKQAAGAMAALSPQKDWNMNVSLADRTADILANKNDIETTPEMLQKAKELTKGGGNAAMKSLVKNLKDKKLSDLDDPIEKAAWIRLYDEAHNPRSYNEIAPDGTVIGKAKNVGGEDSKVAWGDLGSIAKATSILADGSRENISRQLGSMHKVRNFYNNIIDPNSPHPDVTIDTHAVAAGHIQPFSGASKEVAQNFGGPSSAITGSNGTYPLYAEAYRRAADRLGLKPRELQSIVWEQVRDLFPAEWKTAANAKKVSKIWGEYGKGNLTLDETRKQIVDLAGGFHTPEWYKQRSGAGVPEEK